MANLDAPFGLIPIKHKNGAPYNGASNAYYVPATYGTALYIGDPVIVTSTSNTAEVQGNVAGSLPEVNKCTAGDGNAISGVIVGFTSVSTNAALTYNPASTECIVHVADDPDLVFLIQDDGGVALAATSVNLNAVLIFTTAGNTVTGKSGVEMDSGTTDAPAADASNQLTIRKLHNRVGNELGEYGIWEVTINNHTNAHGAIGI